MYVWLCACFAKEKTRYLLPNSLERAFRSFRAFVNACARPHHPRDLNRHFTTRHFTKPANVVTYPLLGQLIAAGASDTLAARPCARAPLKSRPTPRRL